MSSTVIGLPSISTAYQTLKGLADPLADKRTAEESKLKWEQLCLAALSYGTDYSVPTLRIHAKGSITTAHASEVQQHPKLKLKIRANKALSFFIDVIASFDADIAASTKLQGQSQHGRDETCKNQLYLQQIDPVRLILVDALWIVGQLLVPPDTTYSISSNDDTSNSKSNQSNKVITQNLDTSDPSNRNTSLVDNQVDQRPSLSLEEEEEMREDSMVAFTYIVQGLAGLKVDPMPVSASARSNASASFTPTLSPHLLQMLLDPYQLSKAAIVPHEQFIRKYRKYQTNILYRQRRFNLLTEESEGWAKILALLSSLPSENDSAISVLEKLRGYIGAFDLDPNRLLSILIDVLELELDRTLDEILKETSADVDGQVRQSTSHGGRIVGDTTLALLLKLISDFKVSAIPHLLGFKFQNLSTSNSTLTPDDKTHKDLKEAEPLIEDAAAFSTSLIQKLKPFYNLTAFLVAHEVVSLEELFPYFAPRADISTSKVDDRDTSSNVSNQAVSSNVSAPLILREWTKAKQKEVAHDVRTWGLVSLNASNTNTTEVKTSDETEKRCLEVDNEIPVLVLLESLLSFGAWDQFAALLELCRFPPPLPLSFLPSQRQKLEATSTGKPSDVDVILLRPTIGKVLCEFLHFLLDPWCRRSSMSPPCLWSNAKVSATFTKVTEATGQWPFKAERCKGFFVKCLNQFIPVTPAVKNLLSARIEDSHLIDYIFEPIMVLASSHEAVLDATLYLKICRLFQSLLERDFEESPGSNLSQRAKIIFQYYLLPAQSLYPANPQLSFALWSCLKLLPYTIRYSLYDAWAQGPRNYRHSLGTPFPLERSAISKTALTGNGCMNFDKSLWAVRTEVMAGKETRSVLKRLAKETILEQSRRFAKVSCTSPIVALSILIQQMQAYDNMIDLMVDSFRLCSDLSRDVLVWCLLQNLASFDGSKLDITTTQLLTSIETFTGTLYRTFPYLEVRGIFDWLLSRLVAPGPVISTTLAGLGVIRSLLTTAGGLETVGGEGGAVSGQQLEGRAGSQLLRRETVSFGIVDRVNPVASASLLGILLSPIGSLKGNNIGVALLIRLAQLRLKVLFDPNFQHKDVMQLGKTCDSIQTTQLLLLEFLSTPRDWKESEAEETIETYSSNIPSLERLLDREVGYGIDAAAAFAIVRPCIRAALMAEEAILERREQEEAELLERGESSHSGGGRETEGALGVPTLYKRWLPSAPEIRRACQSLIPCRFQNSISCMLYCTFWSLDLFDLYVPKHRYTVEINRLNKEEERLKQKRAVASETLPFTPTDAAELHRVAKNAAKLKDDQLKQIDHCKFVKSKKFEADIDKFFSYPHRDREENEMGDAISVDNNDGGNSESSAKAFLTICIFPRALSSPDGAFYCSHFVQRLHNMNTPRFHTLQFFDHLVNATIGALMYFTEEEAQNFGILIEALWSVIVDWRYGKGDKREAENAYYEREVMSKQGSFLDESSEPVTYEKYKSLYLIWHDRLGKAFLGCLEAKSKGADDRLTNLRVRSAINILTRLVRIYPTRPQVGDMLFKRLKFLQEDESRPETKVMANAYVAQLTKAMLEGCWKEQTVMEKREWEEQNQKRAKERKKRAEETQKEMAAENARIDRLAEVRDSRGRGDNTRLVREWEKTSDRRRVEEKILRSPPHLPDTIPLNATADKLGDWDREREREYRDRERGADRGRNIEAFSDLGRRGARGVRSAHAWQVPSSSGSKAAGSGLEGRWHGTLSTALPPEKNDARDGGGKRGRSPSDDRNNSAPPEKKTKSDEDRGRAHGKARPGSIRYDSTNSGGRGDPSGWRH